MNELPTPVPRWMGAVLWAAAAYNICFGVLVVVFPEAAFRWADMEPPNYPALWQCIGMIVGVYGVGYAIAAGDPLRHWPIVLVGLLGKVFGPIGFLEAALRGTLPWHAGLVNVTNDLIWWAPFSLILFRATRNSRDGCPAASNASAGQPSISRNGATRP
ncbi:MAG: alkyl hydroperoxide reductase [Gemmataceae bacterium]|nr:alkyl hydroperoxide reductase [Gemmataceae bacterium]